MQEDRLKNAFEYVRQMFFPEWDRKREWKILECPEELRTHQGKGVDGVCSEQAKTIKVSMVRISENIDLYVLLIHEICHSGTKGHGKDWQEAMLMKADIADKMGKKDLSELIRKDIERAATLDRSVENAINNIQTFPSVGT